MREIVILDPPLPFDAPPQGQTISGLPLGWLLRNRANTADVQSWIPCGSDETRGKTVLFLGKHRVTPCRKQPAAVSCTPGTPREPRAGPALLTEPGVAMGLGAEAGSERS